MVWYSITQIESESESERERERYSMVWCFLSGISRKTTMFYFRKQVISETSCNIHPILKIVSNLVLTNHNLEIYLDLENGIAYVML